VTASTNITNLAFLFTPPSGRGTGASLFLDDTSVEVPGVPDGGTTVSLLGSSLLGLAALRRKLNC
jgi:hypothetical protein